MKSEAEELAEIVRKIFRSWQKKLVGPEDFVKNFPLITQRFDTNEPYENKYLFQSNISIVIRHGLRILEDLDPLGSQVLDLRYIQNNSARAAAKKLKISEVWLYKLQRKAIYDLTRLLIEEEKKLRDSKVNEIESNLPASNYFLFFGQKSPQNDLFEFLRKSSAPWIFSIVGIGGIGKTALADFVIRKITSEFIFDEIVYIRTSAEGTLPEERVFEKIFTKIGQRILPLGGGNKVEMAHVREKLKKRPHLIWIDNLEQEDQTIEILEKLRSLGGPSKFLITAREHPPEMAGIATLSLGELTISDSVLLIKDFASQIHLDGPVRENEDIQKMIFHTIGGNPLALKLVVGLAKKWPINTILEDIPKARLSPIGEMYRNIYWKTWLSLSDPAKALLELLPLIGEKGALIDQLQSISRLENPVVNNVIRELLNHSLLELRTSTSGYRYGIHRLTEMFLRTEIIKI